MKILLDENLPHELRFLLVGHLVETAQFRRWQSIADRELLRLAAASGFDVLLTMDAGLRHQQNLATLPMSVIIIHEASNDIEDLAPIVPRILVAIVGMEPKTLLAVS